IGVTGEQLGLDLARWVVFGMVFFAYHFGCLVAREGRTLGKTAVDICVISAAGQPLSIAQCMLRSGVRATPFIMLSVPGIDVVGALLLLALLLVEFYLIEQPPSRQTVADRVAHSLVVKLPPLQPHRAPAGPMFSAHDTEFGFPPQRPRGDDQDRQSRANQSPA
ncbi:MAG TPA: RDD family protein, partial [Burkholderiales bacterium]|nr:RDD family protein [Burkholderiales bacterium]